MSAIYIKDNGDGTYSWTFELTGGTLRFRSYQEEAPFTADDFNRRYRARATTAHFSATGIFAPPRDVQEAYSLLGLSTTDKHTAEEIKAAFRAKVKESATGDGGYHGDMDTLVKAKGVR